MLVLSRKVGEKIQIGDLITVVVTRIAGNRVTLGVSAPKNVRIVRSELKPISEGAMPVLARHSLAAPEPGPVTVDVSPIGVALRAR